MKDVVISDITTAGSHKSKDFLISIALLSNINRLATGSLSGRARSKKGIS